MKTHRISGCLGRVAIGLTLTYVTGCVETVRVPLAVPLPALGGSRPAGPQGIHLAMGFGDGLWGQEQVRAEMVGGELGFSLRDRVEILSSAYTTTRTVTDSSGGDHPAETTGGIRGKLRLQDLRDGRASVGVHVAVMSGERVTLDTQDERLHAVDIAVPFELYPLAGPLPDTRLGVYAAPRLIFQSFRDRRAGESSKGTVKAAVVGVTGRWRYFSLSGELNFARTPEMRFAGTTVEPGTQVLPFLGVRGIIPIGN